MIQTHKPCPGNSLPTDASLSERAEACKGCTEDICADKEALSAGTRSRNIAYFILFFCVVAAIILLIKLNLF